MIEQLTEAAIARHTNPWEWVETRLAALSEAAQLVGIMPPTVWGREIVRLSRRLDLDVTTVQAQVLKASSGPGDAQRQRGDLDLPTTSTATSASLAIQPNSSPKATRIR